MGTLQPNLVPLCELKALLQPAIAVTLPGQGGLQIGEVAEARITGSRFSGVMIGTASEWLAMAPDGSWGRMDVRGSFKADDGAIFAVRYGGRIRIDRQEASASLVVAPTFETGYASHDWLNLVQAIGKGRLNLKTGELSYEFFEVV
jgi:hypothetical protein